MMKTYTVSDLVSQLHHARAMMARIGMPYLRLTRTCDEDTTLARQIEDNDPFQAWKHAKNPDTILFTTPIYMWGDENTHDDTEQFRHGSMLRP